MRAAPTAALLVLAACSGSGRRWSDPPPAQADLAVAVGAHVTVKLDRCSPPATSPGELCVDFDPADAHDITVGPGPFDATTAVTVDRVVQIPLHATAAGTARLVIPHRDIIFGEKTTVFVLAAAAITSATVGVICDWSALEGDVVPVTAGASFRFRARALAGDTPLLSGDLELVDAPGFTLSPPADDDTRGATAPTSTGTFPWRLVGGGSRDFVVYDPAQLGVELEAAGPDLLTGATRVRVARTVAGAPVCVHGQSERAVVEVTAGACRPATSYAEVDGPMPISLRDGDWTFELAADARASCTAQVRLDSGATRTITLDAIPPPPVELVSTGSPIGTAGVTIDQPLPAEGDCGGSLSDGDCDGKLEWPPVPRDGDCYINSEWEVDHRDGTRAPGDAIGDGDFLGVGLTTELHATIVGNVLALPMFPIPVGPPRNLRYTVIPGGALRLESLGCNAALEQVFKLTPLASNILGSVVLELDADNLDDTEHMLLNVHDIDRAVFETRDKATRKLAGAATVSFFVASSASLAVGYEGQGARLRGTAPFVVTSDSPTARLGLGGDLYTGDTPDTTVVVTAPAAGSQAQTIRVLAPSAIAAISGFKDEYGTIGIPHCVELLPADGARAPIYGRRPSRPRLALAGPAFVMGRDQLPGQFCLEPVAPGFSTVTLTWGVASAQQRWSATPTPTQ